MKTLIIILINTCLILNSYGTTPPHRKKLSNKPKIINGANVTLPYQALLSTNPMDLSGSYHGGGVLITPRCIATAKHVVAGGGNNLKAYVGIGNRNQATQPITISKSVNNANADISLIFLTNDVPNVNNVNPSIKLASENNSIWWNTGNSLDVSGFGILFTNTTSVSMDCKRVSVSVHSSTTSTPDMIVCQGPGTNDACQGDSGGPLVKAGDNVLTGIVSTDFSGNPTPISGAKNNCGQGGRYVRVSKYLDWIVEQIFLQNTPNFICSSTTTNIETLPFMPDGCTMTWSVQSDSGSPTTLFSTSVGAGNLSFNVSAFNSTVQGFGTIRLVFTSPGNPPRTAIKRVWVGSPPSPISIVTDGSFSFNGSSASVCRTFGYCMTSNNLKFVDPNPLIGTSYSVRDYTYTGSFPAANGSNAFFNKSTTSVTDDRVCFGSNVTNTYTINVVANNTCGISNRMVFVTVNNCGFRVFPNPAKDVVKIEFESPDKLESIPDLIELYDEKQQKKAKSVDFSKNKKEKIDIDVSDLARGTYCLKMSFAKKTETETVRLILE